MMSWEQHEGRSKHVDFMNVKRSSMSNLLATGDEETATILVNNPDIVTDEPHETTLNALDGLANRPSSANSRTSSRNDNF